MGQNFCPTRVLSWIIGKGIRTGEITPVLILCFRLKAKADEA
jgi:hypothetical protein